MWICSSKHGFGWPRLVSMDTVASKYSRATQVIEIDAALWVYRRLLRRERCWGVPAEGAHLSQTPSPPCPAWQSSATVPAPPDAGLRWSAALRPTAVAGTVTAASYNSPGITISKLSSLPSVGCSSHFPQMLDKRRDGAPILLPLLARALQLRRQHSLAALHRCRPRPS